jgi:SAM-dependent methyltransferase
VRPAVVPYLACPSCAGDLRLAEAEREGDHVMAGTLTCAGCGHIYPISRGVPRLVPGTVASEATQTARRFGDQWKTFAHMSEYQEDWLRRWLDPVGPGDVRGKVLLEAGCGKGRHTVVAAGWGAKAVLALDLGDAVDVAFAHTRGLANAHVIQADLLHAPVRPVDLAFSIGVLHHLPDPQAGFDALCGRVRPGGKIAIWVYGYESNEWIVRWVNPLRQKVTARMSPRLLYWLSYAPSAALAAGIKMRRPRHPYMQRLADLPLREIHNIVFDQLVTPIAFYLREEEVRAWFSRDGLADVTIAWHNQNSWRASATVNSPA